MNTGQTTSMASISIGINVARLLKLKVSLLMMLQKQQHDRMNRNRNWSDGSTDSCRGRNIWIEQAAAEAGKEIQQAVQAASLRGEAV